MKLAEVTTLVAVVGALVLVGLDKMDVATLLALVGGVLLKNPLPDRTDDEVDVD